MTPAILGNQPSTLSIYQSSKKPGEDPKTLKVQDTELKFDNLLKIDAGKEIPAAQAAWKNGTDEVFFKAGNDTYVLSGEGLPLGKLDVGSSFSFMGQDAKITYKHDEINSTKDGLISGLKNAGRGVLLSAGFAGVIGGVIGGMVGAGSLSGVVKGVGVGMGVGIVSGGTVGVIMGAISTSISTATGSVHSQSELDSNILKAFGK